MKRVTSRPVSDSRVSSTRHESRLSLMRNRGRGKSQIGAKSPGSLGANAGTALKYRLVYKSSILDRGSIMSRAVTFAARDRNGIGRKIAGPIWSPAIATVRASAMPRTYSYRVATGRPRTSKRARATRGGNREPHRSAGRSYKAAIYGRHRGREEPRAYVGQTARGRRLQRAVYEPINRDL